MKRQHRGALLRLIGGTLALALVLCACAPRQEPEEEQKNNPDVAPLPDIDRMQVRDSETIYADDDDLSVVTMYLTVSQGNELDHTNHTWSDVNSHSVYYYDDLGIDRYAVEGMLQIGDETGPLPGEFGYGEFAPNATVSIRGKTSSRSPQKSYKVKLKKNEGSWRGQSNLPLNKHVYDSVRFRNKLSYDLMKGIPEMFSARTQFVHLYVKDQTEGDTKNAKFVDHGLFTQVEQINKIYLRNHGLDENGQLYKANMFEFFRYEDVIKLSSDPTFDEKAFAGCIESKGSDDHSKLIAMLDELNNLAKPIEEIFPKYFDEDNYFTWLAFQLLTGNRDTTSQNFYLYSPQNGNKWYFISWDNDGAWRFGERQMLGKLNGYNFELGVSNYWGSVLHQRVLKNADYRKKLDDKINQLRAYLTEERITQLVQGYSAITRKYLFAMPDMLYSPRTQPEFDQILNLIPKEIAYNYEMYQSSLRRPLPFFLGVPELMSGKILYQWDSSYDFDNEKVTYTFELARDYKMQSLIHKEEGLEIPQLVLDPLPAGQYFYKVTAVNESGETQTAMEIYPGEDDQDYHGVFCFYVQPDGTITVS